MSPALEQRKFGTKDAAQEFPKSFPHTRSSSSLFLLPLFFKFMFVLDSSSVLLFFVSDVPLVDLVFVFVCLCLAYRFDCQLYSYRLFFFISPCPTYDCVR